MDILFQFPGKSIGKRCGIRIFPEKLNCYVIDGFIRALSGEDRGDQRLKGIAEMQEYERTLKARALNTLRTLTAVRIALKEAEHGNQTKLFYHQEDRSDDNENL